MNHVSDPTLVFARHQRYGTYACLCGWTDYGHTHVEHVLQELAASGWVLVSAGSLVDALGTLGYVVDHLEVAHPEEHKVRIGGVAEVAQACGVGKSAVSMWITRVERTGFPTPYARLASGCVYDLDQVAQWHKTFKATRNGAHT